jgi:hypothetical protein
LDLPDIIRRRPWDSRFYQLPAEAAAVPTMLTPEEGKMLCWLGEHFYQNEGAVVELGSFLGGSTVRLAAGLARSPHPWTLHAYDRFQIEERLKPRFLYSAGYEKFDGTDMFHIFQKHVEPFGDRIVPHPGNAVLNPWIGGPIELLFVDMAKTVESHHHILDSFFPSLMPGSIIIQQDYLHCRTPWLFTAMELLHPKIEFLSSARDNSALFLCNEVPNTEDLEHAHYDTLAADDVEKLIRRARTRFPLEWQREMVGMALDAYKTAPQAKLSWAFPAPDFTRPPSLGSADV